MTTINHAAAAADILKNLSCNVEALESALKTAKLQRSPGYVFCWPTYWLGVRTAADGMNACRIDQAFITHKADKRVFTNGKGEQAKLMPLIEALEGALAHGIEVRDNLATQLSKLEG